MHGKACVSASLGCPESVFYFILNVFFSNGVKRNGIGTDSKIFLRFEMHDKKWCLEMIVEKWAFSWSSTCFEAVKSAEEKGY